MGVLLTVDLVTASVLRREYLRSANEKLSSLLKLAQARPPQSGELADLQSWAEYMAGSGVRVTVIDSAGRVLAETARDPETLENHLNRPEVQQALSTGTGESVR